MATTSDVGMAFWSGRPARGSSVHSTGDKVFSHSTIMIQRLPDGKTIGNDTKYSRSTSKSQTLMGVGNADIHVKNVPRGEDDLRKYVRDD